MKRTFVVGDIHGALKALKQVVTKIHPLKEDCFIFLGDYVDGWSQSAEVITYLMQLSEQYCCIFIKGNHDAWCEDWLRGEPADDTWLRHGGRSTVESYNRLNVEEQQKQLNFFADLYNYYVDEQNRLYIHAGFSSMHGPAHERYASNFSWDRTLWEMAITMDKRIRKDDKLYPKRLLLYNEIFIGHTPTLNYDTDRPMQGCNVWNMDTGAAYYGRLSAMNVDTKEVFQSDVVQGLYPGEKGRNK